MNKKILIFLFLPLFIISLSFYIWYFINKNTTNNDKNQKLNNTINQTQIEKQKITKEQIELNNQREELETIKTINTAWEKWDITVCENIKNIDKKTECLNNWFAAKAWIENNKMYCYKIKDITLKNRCIDNYFYNDAVNNKNEISQTCLANFILYVWKFYKISLNLYWLFIFLYI